MGLILTAVVAAFTLSAWLTWRFCDPASRFHILDYPNARSLHAHPIPRSGGLAILTGFAVGAVTIGLTANMEILPWLSAGMLLVAVVSFIDDYSGVPVWLRLLAHLASAAILIWGAGLAIPLEFTFGIGFSWFVSAITLLYLVWMINLYNFMDGMDGFAAGMALIGFGTFAGLGLMAGHGLFAALSLLIAAATAGFLLFNFPPARIFMGDVGSSSLGLLAAAMALWGARDAVFPFWVGLLVFSPFIVDATMTLGRRLLHGEKIWQAHKTHYYQRLVQLGWGHRKTLLYEYVLMLACGMSALLAVRMGATGQWLLIFIWSGLYLALMAAVTRLEKAMIRL